MSAHRKVTEALAFLGGIKPDAHAAGTLTSGWVSVAEFNAFAALITAGDLGSSATLDAKIQQATDASGTGAKDITGKAITQLTQAGSGSNKQAWINFLASDLDTANGFGFVRISMTVATATLDADAKLFGLGPKQSPATAYDATSVAEVVG